MRISTLRGYMIVGFLSFFMVVSLGSCSANKTKGYAWTDLKHARELDKKKGKRSKKYQKNVSRSKKY